MPFPKSYCNICFYCQSDQRNVGWGLPHRWDYREAIWWGKPPPYRLSFRLPARQRLSFRAKRSAAEESIKTTIAEGDSNIVRIQ
jgi:hypothetical protein